MYSATLKAE